MKPRFFKTEKELRHWFTKNHDRAQEIWVGLYKGKSNDGRLTQRQAIDQSLCFGWGSGVIKGLDILTYTIKFVPRRSRSGWSYLNKKRFLELQKQGLVHRAGSAAFARRDDTKSFQENPRLPTRYLKIFRADRLAWSFFSAQTESYQRYTTWWVISAKQEKTRDKRFQMLLEDSRNQHKLTRILKAIAQVSRKKEYPVGQTPIEAGRNIGPVTGGELRSIGVETVEKFKRLGWERTFRLMVQHYPHRLNLNMAVGLLALQEDQDWRKLDPDLKAEARALILDLKRGLR